MNEEKLKKIIREIWKLMEWEEIDISFRIQNVPQAGKSIDVAFYGSSAYVDGFRTERIVFHKYDL